MFLYDYFLEIKNRLILISICYVVTFAVCYFYKETLLFFLVKLGIKDNKLNLFYFISTNLTDVLSVYLDLSNFIAIQSFALVFFYHTLMFFSAGLFDYEYQKIKFILLNSFCFVLGSVVIYNICILPWIWLFFLSFNDESLFSVNIFFESKITEYIKLYKSFYVIIVLISQIFVVFFFSMEWVKNKIKFVAFTRKIFYFIFLVIATATTPPDVFSQLIAILSFVSIFEVLVISILLKDLVFKIITLNLNNYNYFCYFCLN